MRHTLYLALLILVGCDSVDPHPDGPIEATGHVALADTGAPLVGLGVAIVANAGVGDQLVASTRTDSAGRFSIRYVVPERGLRATSVRYTVEVNYPYRSGYTAWFQRMNPPAIVDLGAIELERTEPQ